MSHIQQWLRKPKSPVFLIAAIIIGSISTVLLVQHFRKQPQETPSATAPGITVTPGNYKFLLPEGYRFVHPMHMTEPAEESKRFDSVKHRILGTISEAMGHNDLSEASVYVKDFTNGEWMLINPAEKYHPGSLFKVVTLIAYYRMALKAPDVWATKWPYAPQRSDNAVPGNERTLYSTAELARKMIVDNDDVATKILHQHMNKGEFMRIFSDLHLPPPSGIPDTAYQTTAKEYSRFVNAVYESDYLPLSASESAIALLCQSSFKGGIVAGLPEGTVVAHKHGEVETSANREIHETGIVYRKGYPYLITVMTRGHDINKQATLIASISQIVWEEMSKTN